MSTDIYWETVGDVEVSYVQEPGEVDDGRAVNDGPALVIGPLVVEARTRADLVEWVGALLDKVRRCDCGEIHEVDHA